MKHPSTLLAAAALASACALAQNPSTEKPAMPEPAAPAVVYFTHDISPEGLVKAYKALGRPLEGRKVAVKISTGEAGNNHYLKPALIGPSSSRSRATSSSATRPTPAGACTPPTTARSSPTTGSTPSRRSSSWTSSRISRSFQTTLSPQTQKNP